MHSQNAVEPNVASNHDASQEVEASTPLTIEQLCLVGGGEASVVTI